MTDKSSGSILEWRRIKCWGRDYTRVPDALDKLSSGTDESATEAVNSLENVVVLQGGLSESAFYILPFLINHIARSDANGKEAALNLLIDIAVGAADEDAIVTFDFAEEPVWHVVPSADGLSLQLHIACRLVITSHLATIVGAFFDSDLATAKTAGDLLDCFPEFCYYITQLLDGTAKRLGVSEDTRKRMNRLKSSLRNS